jgi:hypothetical protein
MPAYIVGYGLTNPDRDHPHLSEAKKGKYRYWRIVEFNHPHLWGVLHRLHPAHDADPSKPDNTSAGLR